MSVNLEGAVGEVKFTLEITRAETGEVEVYDMVGVVTDGELEEPQPSEQEQ